MQLTADRDPSLSDRPGARAVPTTSVVRSAPGPVRSGGNDTADIAQIQVSSVPVSYSITVGGTADISDRLESPKSCWAMIGIEDSIST